MDDELTLFDVRPETQWLTTYEFSWTTDKRFYKDNPPTGSTISFYAQRAMGGDATLEILNVSGEVQRSMDLEVEGGLNTIFWDMRGDPPPAMELPEGAPQRFRGQRRAPMLEPGTYLARLTVAGEVHTTTVVIEQDVPGYMGR
jgi:hypothetical protein